MEYLLPYYEAQTVYLGNLARRENGNIPPLRWNWELTDASRWFAWDSVENRTEPFCGHQDTNGEWPSDRQAAFGYPGVCGAENSFCGFVSPEQAIQGWLDSSGHRANLLNPDSREIGVGYYLRTSDRRGYVAQGFGQDSNYPPLIIDNEAITTTANYVELYIYDRETGGFVGDDPATEMMISNTPDFVNASWEPYQSTKLWSLLPGEGWRTVYVKTKDKSNRILTASDVIYQGADVPLAELGRAQMSSNENKN